MAKGVPTTTQLHSFHTPAMKWSKSSKLGFSSTWTKNFQKYKLGLERKGRGTRDRIANICWITEKARKFQKNIYFCFIDNNKASDCVDQNKLWKIVKDMEIPDHLTYLICFLRNLYAGQEATVRTRHETMDSFKIGKGVCQAVCCCHPAYLTYMQSTLCKMPGWMNHKLESRLLGEIPTTSDT